MALVVDVLEYSRAPVKDGVIRGVKIVGTKSKHGYTYPQEMLRRHIDAYEGVPCYMLHGTGREKKTESRKLHEHFGTIMNVHEREGIDGLWGDLHIKQSHPMAGLVIENLDGANFGLSHNARVETNEDKTEVLSIYRVNSVDLVDNPATTRNLFEDNSMTLEEMNAALDERLGAFQEKMLAAMEAMKPAEIVEEEDKKPAPKKRVQVLEDRVPEDQPAPIGNSHDDFLGVLRGFATTNSGA